MCKWKKEASAGEKVPPPPTTPLSKIRYQNRSHSPPSTTQQGSTYANKVSLGLFQKVFFSYNLKEQVSWTFSVLYTVLTNVFAVLKWCRWRHYMFIVVDAILLSDYDFPLRFPCSQRTKLNTRRKIGPRLPSIRAHKTLHRKMIKSLLKPLPLINNRHCASSVASARGETRLHLHSERWTCLRGRLTIWID